MKQNKAFTLVELLVVIAIIALLLAIVVPAIKMAKLKAAAAVCMTNAKNISLAWFSYQSDTDGRLMGSDTARRDKKYAAWVQHPINSNGVPIDTWNSRPPSVVTDEDEKRGIAAGKMYEIGIDSYDVYHCPVDKRRSKYDETNIFRTYAIPACLNGGGGPTLKKFHEITQPSMRYNVVEEAEGRNFNSGSWDFYTSKTNPMGPFAYWRDPIGINHGDKGILAFCDGHAESYWWRDPQTKKRLDYYFAHLDIHYYGYGGADRLNDRYPRDPTQVTDLQYMERGWAYQK